MVLLIDNYDSFTYNLVDYCIQLGAQVQVHRNDGISLEAITTLQPEAIVLSPGPGNPNQAGICLPLIRRFAGQFPILGVCLGHQAIAQAFGGRIIRAPQVMHGKTSRIYHNRKGPFAGLPMPFSATRYHSLVVDPDTLPEDFEVIAWAKPSIIMALRHRTLPLMGVQFHPEAILTEYGLQFLRQALSGL